MMFSCILPKLRADRRPVSMDRSPRFPTRPDAALIFFLIFFLHNMAGFPIPA